MCRVRVLVDRCFVFLFLFCGLCRLFVCSFGPVDATVLLRPPRRPLCARKGKGGNEPPRASPSSSSGSPAPPAVLAPPSPSRLVGRDAGSFVVRGGETLAELGKGNEAEAKRGLRAKPKGKEGATKRTSSSSGLRAGEGLGKGDCRTKQTHHGRNNTTNETRTSNHTRFGSFPCFFLPMSTVVSPPSSSADWQAVASSSLDGQMVKSLCLVHQAVFMRDTEMVTKRNETKQKEKTENEKHIHRGRHRIGRGG